MSRIRLPPKPAATPKPSQESSPVQQQQQDQKKTPKTPWRLPPAPEVLKREPELEFTQPERPYILHASLLGAPNSGKSTLVNALAGEKVPFSFQ